MRQVSFLCGGSIEIEQNSAQPKSQPLTVDPLYYGTVIAFALLTTALPAVLAQPRFLPIAQAVALTVFLAIPLRAGYWRRAIWVMTVFLITAFAVIASLTYWIPQQIEASIPSGFALRSDLVAWSFGVGLWPGSPQTAPFSQLVEFAGVCLGALITAGLAGNWFLVRAVDSTGFSAGLLARTLAGPLGFLLSMPVWRALWIGGLAGSVILLSQPILSGRWSPRYYLANQRALVLWSAILLVLGFLAGILLPSLWQSVIAAWIL